MFKFNKILILSLMTCFNSIFSYDVKEYEKLILRISEDPVYQTDFSENLDYLLSLDSNYFDYQLEDDFICDVSDANKTPTSVHGLRPSDIKVVAALGDSITAAFGARAHTPLGLLIENRGNFFIQQT